MSQNQPKPSSIRVNIAHALPGLLMFLFFLTWLPEKNIVGRVILSAFGGAVFQGGALLLLLVVSALVARVAGDANQDALQ
jgi:hypothetical protein